MVMGKASPAAGEEPPFPEAGGVPWGVELLEQAAMPTVAVAASIATKVLLESTWAPFISGMAQQW